MSDRPLRRDLGLSHDSRSSRRRVLRRLYSYLGHELLQTPFKHGALQQHSASAPLAAQTNVRTETRDLPIGATAWVRFAQAQHVAEAEFEDD